MRRFATYYLFLQAVLLTVFGPGNKNAEHLGVKAEIGVATERLLTLVLSLSTIRLKPQ